MIEMMEIIEMIEMIDRIDGSKFTSLIRSWCIS